MTRPAPLRRGPRRLIAAFVFTGTIALTGLAVVYLVTTGWGLLVGLWAWALAQ